MNCEFCNKPARIEPINRRFFNGYSEIWRCPDCRAQFTIDKKAKGICHIVFFVDIKDKPYCVELWIPVGVNARSATIVKQLPNSTNKEIVEVLNLPLMRNITPTNVESKLKTWLIFS